MLNANSLKLAGWLAILSAVVTLPVMAIGLISGFTEEKSRLFSSIEIISTVAYTFLYVYLFLMLRRLLNEKAGFYAVDWLITTLIALNVVLTGISLLMFLFPEMELAIGLAILVMLIPLGIITVIFGIKLQGCPDDLFGYLKPFAYMMIATGAMLASIILMLLTPLTSIASDVILAIIFFKSADLMTVKTN